MRLIKKQGDMFTSDAPALAHGVNIYGRMGAGIALQFRNRYPVMYDDYLVACQNNDLEPGGLWGWIDPDTQKMIYNVASQESPGRDAKIEWLASGLNAALDHADKMRYNKVAVPMIGTGIGGLPWPLVEAFMRGIAESHDADIEVWEYESE
jgi:O-acetyl-ADP-ribose deacetylase (regulator of RNase III)